MDLGIAGRCAVVLAGGGGLGSASALALGSEGVRVAVADISQDRAEHSVLRVLEAGGRAKAYHCNIGDEASIESLYARVSDDFGSPDILVNITGGPPTYRASDVPFDAWEQEFKKMVLGVIRLTTLALPAMRHSQWGRVITSTSSGVLAPIPGLVLSNALRLALVGWSKSLAGEVGHDGVTANVIVPGRIATERVQQLDNERSAREGVAVEAVRAGSWATIPVGRYGTPEEFGSVVAFLASSAASYVTGSVLRVDGGLVSSI